MVSFIIIKARKQTNVKNLGHGSQPRLSTATSQTSQESGDGEIKIK
jgi:hypothetical protein